MCVCVVHTKMPVQRPTFHRERRRAIWYGHAGGGSLMLTCRTVWRRWNGVDVTGIAKRRIFRQMLKTTWVILCQIAQIQAYSSWFHRSPPSPLAAVRRRLGRPPPRSPEIRTATRVSVFPGASQGGCEERAVRLVRHPPTRDKYETPSHEFTAIIMNASDSRRPCHRCQ